jgi:hypothetical protein
MVNPQPIAIMNANLDPSVGNEMYVHKFPLTSVIFLKCILLTFFVRLCSQDPDGGMKVVAASVKEIFLDMGGWSVGDLTVGLRYLARSKAALPPQQPENPIQNADLVAEMMYVAEITKGTYAGSKEELLKRCLLKPENVIAMQWMSTITRPAYFIAIDDRRLNAVVLAIRGTASLKDALTDLAATVDEFGIGFGHRGMVRAANWFRDCEMERLQKLCKEKSLKLIVCGHSLGAGTAALVTMLFKSHFDDIHCYAFAPPASVSDGLCAMTEDHITSVILGDDIVPRFSTVSVENLRQEVIDYPWANELKNDIMTSRVGMLALETKSRVTKTTKDMKIDQHYAKLKLKAISTYSDLDTKYKVSERRASAATAIKNGAASVANSVSKVSSFLTSKVKGSNKDLKADAKSGDPPMELSHEGETAEGMVDHDQAVEDDRKIAQSVQLYPPGRLHHIMRFEGRFYMVQKKFDEFNSIVLSPFSLKDHYMDNYYGALFDMKRYL